MRTREPPECGSDPWGVARHRREGTEVCGKCREALKEYNRDWRAARRRSELAAAAEATRRKREAEAVAAVEGPVLAAHFAGELVLGGRR